ncbi:hypothetical protein NMY22_g17017 [Coprinellus aureogranulatus]|nr:hypothetical protein NMY22_g17017 [Coprinellus aureogranulatus]
MSNPPNPAKRKADVLTPRHDRRAKAPNTSSTPLPSLTSLSESIDDIFASSSDDSDTGNRDRPPHSSMASTTNLQGGTAPPPFVPTSSIPNNIRFTSAPPDKLGDIHITPSHVFDFFSKEDVEKFTQFVEGSQYTVLATLADDSPKSDLNLSRDVMHQMLGIAGGFDNVRARFGGCHDVPKRNVKQDLAPARFYYLTHLEKDQFERLTKTRRVWNCDFGTMVTHPWPLPITGFATTISGLAARSVDTGEITEAVKNGLYLSRPALDFVASGKADAIPGRSEGMAEDLLVKVASSIVVVARDPPTTAPTRTPSQWAVYTIPVTTRHNYWEEWIAIMGNVVIETDIGTGNKNGAPKIHCRICQSVDHTRDYCYHPKTEGWVPQVKLIEDRPFKARKNGGGKGPRDDRRGGNKRGKPY